MSLSLAEIDHTISREPGFRIVDKFSIVESGVDPIGLRQLNLDLMDATVPGINNVTTHIRPYAFMAWAWWKAAKVAEENGKLSTGVVSDLAARYEILYAWAHSLSGQPFRGAVLLKSKLPLRNSDDTYIFKGPAWEKLKANYTGFMAPTEYGPSIKALRWLRKEGDFFVPTQQVMQAVSWIDRVVSSKVPEVVIRLAPPSVKCDQVMPFAEELNVLSPSTAEQEAFRFLFYSGVSDPYAPNDLHRRRATINIIRGIAPAGQAVQLDSVRRSLAACKTLRDNNDSDDEYVSSLLLVVLQARQLQRLATEALMFWLERTLSDEVARAVPIEDLVSHAQESASRDDSVIASAEVLGDYLDAIDNLGRTDGWPEAAGKPGTDVTGMVQDLDRVQRSDVTKIPALALRSFAIVYAVTKALEKLDLSKCGFKPSPLEARPDRLPMGLMRQRMDHLRHKPLTALWRDIIESWIIAQHVHWSAVRSSDGKKRLRIGLENQGWIRVRPKPSSVFRATPDRLFTLLSLGSECGIFTVGSDGAFSSLSLA